MRTAFIVTGLMLGPALLLGGLRLPGQRAQVPVVRAAMCSQLVVPVNQPAPDGCARVSAGDIGSLPLELDVGGRTVRLAEWTATDETQEEFVGFAAHLPGDVVYMVRAGDDVFLGSGARWLHPAGLVGPKVHGIDQVTFCRLPAPDRGCGAVAVVIDESLPTPTLAAR
ncbi:MAG: hypothetical protein AB1730_15555 [Myxococcota bacterium]